MEHHCFDTNTILHGYSRNLMPAEKHCLKWLERNTDHMHSLEKMAKFCENAAHMDAFGCEETKQDVVMRAAQQHLADSSGDFKKRLAAPEPDLRPAKRSRLCDRGYCPFSTRLAWGPENDERLAKALKTMDRQDAAPQPASSATPQIVLTAPPQPHIMQELTPPAPQPAPAPQLVQDVTPPAPQPARQVTLLQCVPQPAPTAASSGAASSADASSAPARSDLRMLLRHDGYELQPGPEQTGGE